MGGSIIFKKILVKGSWPRKKNALEIAVVP